MADGDATHDPAPTQAALDGQTVTQAASGQPQTPTQEPPGGVTAAELAKQEQESRAQLDDVLTRFRDAEAERDKIKSEFEEATKRHEAELAEVRAGMKRDSLRIENAKLRAIVGSAFGERMNIDTELKYVGMDGVTFEEDGTMKGVPSYRPMPQLHVGNALDASASGTNKNASGGEAQQAPGIGQPAGYSADGFANAV